MQNNFIQGWDLAVMGFKKLGKNVQISKSAEFINPQNISIGDNVRIDSFTIIAAGEKGVHIGNYVHISTCVSIVGHGSVIIGDFAGLSAGVKLFSSSDDYSGEYLSNPCVPAKYKKTDHSDVYIGRHVIVGANSVVLPGTHMQDGSVAGSLSLIKGFVGGARMVAGIPAKFIKLRKENIFELENEFLNEINNNNEHLSA